MAFSKCVDFFSAILYGRPMKKRRSQKIILTPEGRVLRALRLESGYSMREAGRRAGVSDSLIAHIETGRIDPPTGDRLERLLKVYGGIKTKSFYERVRGYEEKTSPRDELIELVKRAGQEQVAMLLSAARGLVG